MGSYIILFRKKTASSGSTDPTLHILLLPKN